MATYPTLSTAYGSDPQPLPSITIDRSEDGVARGRSFYTADKHKITLTHELLSSADKSNLEAFYAANRLLIFDYTNPSDGILRQCIFAGRIGYKREPGDYWTAKVELEEV